MNTQKILLITIITFFVVFSSFFYFQKNNTTNTNVKVTPPLSLGMHYSYFSSKDFFDRAYNQMTPSNPVQGEIKGIVVNHHLLAADLIAQAFKTISSNDEKIIILISPNHFFAGRGQIISSLYDWDTPYGILSSDRDLINGLKDRDVLNIDETPFSKEHGISGIVSFIKKSFPNSKVVPIIIKDTASKRNIDEFVNALYDASLNKNFLIVGSFDFSHDFPSNEADIKDKKSISVMENFDYNKIKTVEVDSRNGLEIILKYLSKVGANKFSLFANTNSGKITRDKNLPEVTSYITGVFSLIK